MSRAYSLIVLSDEKKPLPAVDMMDMRVHLALSLYVSSTRSCTGAHSTVSPCVAHTCIKHTLLLITQQSIQASYNPCAANVLSQCQDCTCSKSKTIRTLS